MVLTNLSTDVRLEKGDLMAKQVKFFISGGTIDGNLSLRPQGKIATLALNLKVDQLDISSLLKQLEAKPILEGKLDAEIELNGRGSSMAEPLQLWDKAGLVTNTLTYWVPTWPRAYCG